MIDAATMSIEDLCDFYEREINDAKESDIMLSLVSEKCHLDLLLVLKLLHSYTEKHKTTAPKSNNDEGIGSYPFWPLRESIL